MGLFYTHCGILDDARQINITDLRRSGLLKPDSFIGATIGWKSYGSIVARVSITVNTKGIQHFVMLSYTYNSTELREYKINITYCPSNLGKGKIPYFVCPKTGNKCRKLFGIDGWFLSRGAFKNCYYLKQTYSTNSRIMFNLFDKVCPSEKLFNDRYRKYRKTHYAGKPTRWYKHFLEKVKFQDVNAMERMIVFGKL